VKQHTLQNTVTMYAATSNVGKLNSTLWCVPFRNFSCSWCTCVNRRVNWC